MEPSGYENVSFDKYLSDLSTISNSIIDETSLLELNNKIKEKTVRNEIFSEVNRLDNSQEKENLFQLLNKHF